MDPARKRRVESALFVVFTSLAFAVSGPLARWARPTDPLLIAFGRLTLAALLSARSRRARSGPRSPGLTSRQRLTVLGAGALLAAHFACFQIGLDRTSLPAALRSSRLEPLSVVLCAWVLLGMRPSRPEQIGVVVATAGALLVARGAGKVSITSPAISSCSPRSGSTASTSPSRAPQGCAPGAQLRGARLRQRRGDPGLRARRRPARSRGGADLASARARAHRHPLIALVATVLGHTAVQTASRFLPPAIVALVSPGETLGGSSSVRCS